jgi:hypothetical protein
MNDMAFSVIMRRDSLLEVTRARIMRFMTTIIRQTKFSVMY